MDSPVAPLEDDVADARLPELLEVYRAVVRARALEARRDELEQKGGALPRRAAFVPEDAFAGATFSLGADDWLVGEGTETALALARGATLADFVAHAFGRGRNPWNVRERRTVSSDLRNGAHITQAAGIAWGAKIERRALAVLVTFTDDIVTTGEFHNGVNFAGVFKAPVVFLCTSQTALIDVAPAYGIASTVCQAADFSSVARAVADARKRALAGLGPTFVEARIEDARGMTPLRRHLEARGLFNAEQEASLLAEAHSEIDRALSDFVPTGRRTE
ncbi:thiamine pyrophosphate-dependent enzyme [Pendulispora rubella]|uniref:thiamine pyrophosphate-dependent enzyme n=1 Tax=Pendulispora rubella TaxID=2741070 RepID=UPI0030DF7F7C